MTSDSGADGGVRVASAVPGRIRLRALDRQGRSRLTALADEARTWDEAASAEVRAGSASLVLRFDPGQASALADRLLALGVDLRAGAGSPPPAGAAETVTTAATAINRAVGRRLDGTDLRALVPIGLGLLATRRAMRGEERLADAPWYVLAWYASQTFLKFHGGGAAASAHVAPSEET